jgi:DNA polymerase
MDDRDNLLLAARRILVQRLQGLQRAGVEQAPKLPPVVASAAEVDAAMPARQAPAAASRPALPTPARAHIPQDAATDMARSRTAIPPAAKLESLGQQPYPADVPVAAAERQQALDELALRVRGCTLCKELACTRKQTVFGIGNPRPRVVFFGEAPGADEDRQGEPFVGRAGQLLTKIIAACGWERSDVYILNVLKCRPPDNRNPLPPEVANCRQYFERQFEILRPEYIVCVGTVPAQALLETTESVGKLRGRFHRYRGSTVLVTYHPSYLLRNPSAKRFVWDDMQMLLKEMGLPIPGQGGKS